MKTKTHFAFRLDIWDDTGDSIVEHLAGVGDFEVAEVTYRAAVARWPRARITLRQMQLESLLPAFNGTQRMGLLASCRASNAIAPGHPARKNIQSLNKRTALGT
jgi:hypothetical protein